MTRFLLLAVLLASCTARPPASQPEATAVAPSVAPYTPSLRERAFVDTMSRRTFDYFWETTNPRNGLTPDRWPSKSFSSVAAVGFALTAYPIGVERGWISRTDAVNRTHVLLSKLSNAMGDLIVERLKEQDYAPD